MRLKFFPKAPRLCKGQIAACALLSLPLSLLAHTALAEPYISGAPKVLVHGSSAKIYGDLFGSKIPAAPIKFDSFESYKDGDDMVANAGYDNLGGVSKAYIRQDKPYGSHGSRSAKMDYATGKDSMFPRIGNNLPAGTTELYVSYQAYWTQYAGTGGSPFIFKWSRGGANPPYSGVPRFYETIRPDQTGKVVASDRGYVTDLGTTWSSNVVSGQNANRWNRTEYHYKLSTPAGTANGAYETWVNSVKNVDLRNAVTRTTNQSGSTINYVMSPFDGCDSYGTSNGYYFWFDDYYIDNTPARVEVCSGSTWSARGNCEIQIPTEWSPTSITITANQGSIPSQTATTPNTRYLYVVDPAGVANQNGYQLSFGTATAGPATPSPLKVTMTSN